MDTFIWLFAALGLAPLAVGALRLGPSPRAASWTPLAGSVLLCALAFNLTFLWQELWLVIPKAIAGLHPTLFHNDHSWSGHSPVAELLEGAGALATLCSGLAFSARLHKGPRVSPTWRCFIFWMAFQGLFQALAQLAIGTLLPGNDVGRALTYLGAEGASRSVLLIAAIVAMALAGRWLAGRYSAGRDAPSVPPARALAWRIAATAVLASAMAIPFRWPRDIVEVALVPLFVNLVGAGWLVFGLSVTRRPLAGGGERPGVKGPILALAAVLLLCQLGLRPGIRF